MRSTAWLFFAALLLTFSATYSRADFLLNCRLMQPGDPLYRQHCRSEDGIIRAKCREQAECLVIKKRILLRAAPTQAAANHAAAKAPVNILRTATPVTTTVSSSAGSLSTMDSNLGGSVSDAGVAGGALSATAGTIGGL
jgi:hypothetical protein